MNLYKSKKKILLYPVVLLTLLSIVLQIVSIYIPTIENTTTIITLLLTQIIAPITFFIIVFLLWKETKPKIKTYKIILLILGVIVLNFILSVVFNSIISKFFATTSSNPVIKSGGNDLFMTILVLGWAMFGEEAIKLSLFFIIFKSFHYNSEKKVKYWCSWLIVVILFGLLHLNTYQYNFLQSIFVIGLPAMLYGYIWKKTEQPLIMWGTHYLYDIILILISTLV